MKQWELTKSEKSDDTSNNEWNPSVTLLALWKDITTRFIHPTKQLSPK